MSGDESGVHDGKSITEEKVGEDLDGITHHFELISFLEQFDKEQY